MTDLLGHGTASLDHPAHREVLGRAIAWLRGEHPPTDAAIAADPTWRS